MSAQPTYTAPPPTALPPTTTPTPTEIVCKGNSGKIVNIDIPTEYLKHPVNTIFTCRHVMTLNQLMAIRCFICSTGRRQPMTNGFAWG
jgi:hypothetical protein